VNDQIRILRITAVILSVGFLIIEVVPIVGFIIGRISKGQHFSLSDSVWKPIHFLIFGEAAPFLHPVAAAIAILILITFIWTRLEPITYIASAAAMATWAVGYWIHILAAVVG